MLNGRLSCYVDNNGSKTRINLNNLGPQEYYICVVVLNHTSWDTQPGDVVIADEVNCGNFVFIGRS